MWKQVEEVRQVRADHVVEVRLGAVWYLAWECEWAAGSLLPGVQPLGAWVRPW